MEFLKEKLKKLGLNFYIVTSSRKSGFRKEEKTEYVLFSKTGDETILRFFKLVGLRCPEEIKNCCCGSKGGKLHYFKDKWSTDEDWIKILSNVKELGPILREKRLQLGLSQNQLGRIIKIKRENIRDVELSVFGTKFL